MSLLDKPSSFRLLHHVCLLLIVLVNQICSSSSAPSLYQGAQNQTQHSKCGLTSAELTERLTFLDLLQLVLFHHTADSTFLFFIGSPCPFLQHRVSSGQHTTASLYCCTGIFQTRYQNLHLSMMNCMSSLNPFFQPDKVLLKRIPTLPVSTAPTTLSIIPSTNLVKMPFFLLSRQLMTTWNSISPSINPGKRNSSPFPVFQAIAIIWLAYQLTSVLQRTSKIALGATAIPRITI